MKALIILCAALLVAFACPPAQVSAHRHVCTSGDDGHNLCRDDDVELNIRDGSIIFTSEDNETVEITDEYELIVNSKAVSLNDSQRRLVEKYYDSFQYIIEEAKEIGLQGAKIGVHAATLGMTAAIGVLRLLSPDYDSEDLDRDLNRKSEKIERVAEKLEKRAEKIERQANKLEDLHASLRDEIDELDDLGWF